MQGKIRKLLIQIVGYVELLLALVLLVAILLARWAWSWRWACSTANRSGTRGLAT